MTSSVSRPLLCAATTLFLAALLLIGACGPDIQLESGPQSTTPMETTTPTDVPTERYVFPSTLTPLPQSTIAVTTDPPYESVEMTERDQEAYQQALADIELYRKGEMSVIVTDTMGAPVSGYAITYQQLDHDFSFGTVVDPTTADLAMNAGINTITVLPQWWLVEPNNDDYELSFTNYWTGLDELSSMGFRIKTNDIWTPGSEPSYMQDLSFETYLVELEEHVSTLVQRFAPSVDQWEAILEPNYGNHNPYSWSHSQYMQAIATSIRAIRENDPQALIEVSLSYPCGGIPWLNNYAIVDEMLQRGLDFDVLGLQLYYNTYVANPTPYIMTRMSLADIGNCVDQYQSLLEPFGKAIAASEFGVPASAPPGIPGYWGQPWSEDLQAQYLATAFTLLFAKPLNRGLAWWDFQVIPPGGFVHDGGLIDSDYLPRKAYFALQDLIRNWTSSGNDVIGSDGIFTFRGYAGNYALTITDPISGGQMLTNVHLDEQASSEMRIQFIPEDVLRPQKEALSRLIAYWEQFGDQTLVGLAKERLALAEYHQSLGEEAQARRAIESALEMLATTNTLTIPATSFDIAVYQGPGPILDGDWVVAWSGQTLYFPWQFSAGHVSVEVTAKGQGVNGSFPRMVIGIGGHSSLPAIVDHMGVYHAEFDLDGREEVFTIRFLYEESSDPGEFKLFVNKAELSIQVFDAPG